MVRKLKIKPKWDWWNWMMLGYIGGIVNSLFGKLEAEIFVYSILVIISFWLLISFEYKEEVVNLTGERK